MATKLLLLGIRGTEQDRKRLAEAAEALNRHNERNNLPGRVSASDVGIHAVRQYIKELEKQGILLPESWVADLRSLPDVE